MSYRDRGSESLSSLFENVCGDIELQSGEKEKVRGTVTNATPRKTHTVADFEIPLPRAPRPFEIVFTGASMPNLHNNNGTSTVVLGGTTEGNKSK